MINGIWNLNKNIQIQWVNFKFMSWTVTSKEFCCITQWLWNQIFWSYLGLKVVFWSTEKAKKERSFFYGFSIIDCCWQKNAPKWGRLWNKTIRFTVKSCSNQFYCLSRNKRKMNITSSTLCFRSCSQTVLVPIPKQNKAKHSKKMLLLLNKTFAEKQDYLSIIFQ